MSTEIHPTSDTLSVELKALRDNMDTKFTGLSQVINDMREWMSRLTATVERQSENRDRVVGLEHRVATVEAENNMQRALLQSARDQQMKSAVFIAIATSIGTAVIGAVAVAAVGLLF